MKPMKLGCEAFLKSALEYRALCQQHGFELWHTTFGPAHMRPSIHVKIMRDGRAALQWWPSKGTWLTDNGVKGKCQVFADLIPIATAVAKRWAVAEESSRIAVKLERNFSLAESTPDECPFDPTPEHSTPSRDNDVDAEFASMFL